MKFVNTDLIIKNNLLQIFKNPQPVLDKNKNYCISSSPRTMVSVVLAEVLCIVNCTVLGGALFKAKVETNLRYACIAP